MRFRDLGLSIDYSGPGEDILGRFVLPLLHSAKRYDRITSFFTVESLLAISPGLDALRRNAGSMRLILGIHDVPEPLARAALESHDTSSAVIAQVRMRVLAQVATIQSELEAQQIATIAWLIQDGLLAVRVAAPESQSRFGLFHNKAFIFTDSEGDVVAGVGSSNETASGLGANFEHLTVFTSWEVRAYTDSQQRLFERMWSDQVDGLSVRPLDDRFADELLAALPANLRPQRDRMSVGAVLSLASRMESFSFVSGHHAALFPHQERAYLDALSRWPVRVLLSDEVGLGKTFEAGAVLFRLLKSMGAKRALLLVPKAVIKQWQDELLEHFSLEAWIFDSGTRCFISPSGVRQEVRGSDPVLSHSAPRIVLMSAQYARGSRRGEPVFSDGSAWPDVLVVDEAHSARTRFDGAGSVHPTRMWKLLQTLCRRVPHVVFATATPMQIHWREYFGILQLLGLPTAWRVPRNYETSLRLIADSSVPNLQDAFTVAGLLKSSFSEFCPGAGVLELAEQEFVERVCEDGLSSVDAALLVIQSWATARRAFVKLHPAHLLTVRNTRSALARVGYRFPARQIHAPTLDVPEEVHSFYETVDAYLQSAYFSVERAAFPERKFNVGFVRCSYQQRLASSLHACRISLGRRLQRVQQFAMPGCSSSVVELSDLELGESEIYDDDLEIEEEIELAAPCDDAAVQRAAQSEVQWLSDLISSVDGLLDATPDPKVLCAIDLVRRHVHAGDQALVFSRFTDTLDAAIAACLADSQLRPFSFGVYTGSRCQVARDGTFVDCKRHELTHSLETGRVQFIFCSEAASEGLNLQAARVLVNIDVPWNPARLEQRIGRIARLGQRASTVDIYNIWYPNSVEARMYLRLLERKDLYELAVGEFPEVVGGAIRNAIAERYGGKASFSDPIVELQRLRTDRQLQALRELWGMDVSGGTHTGRFRSGLSGLVVTAAARLGAVVTQSEDRVTISYRGQQFSFSLSAGREDSLSLQHPALIFLDSVRLPIGRSLAAMYAGKIPVCFASAEHDTEVLLSPTQVIELLSLLSPFPDASGASRIAPERTPVDLRELLRPWLPDTGRMQVPAELDVAMPAERFVPLSELLSVPVSDNPSF